MVIIILCYLTNGYTCHHHTTSSSVVGKVSPSLSRHAGGMWCASEFLKSRRCTNHKLHHHHQWRLVFTSAYCFMLPSSLGRLQHFMSTCIYHKCSYKRMKHHKFLEERIEESSKKYELLFLNIIIITALVQYECCCKSLFISICVCVLCMPKKY